MKFFAPVHKWDSTGVILAPSSENIHKYCFLGDLFTSNKDEYVRTLLVSPEHYYVLYCQSFVHFSFHCGQSSKMFPVKDINIRK